MKRTIQVRIFRGERKFVAECLDLPVVTEASTLDGLAVNIREAISLHLEGEDLTAMGLARRSDHTGHHRASGIRMMPKLRTLSGGDLIRTFVRSGFLAITQSDKLAAASQTKTKLSLVDRPGDLSYSSRRATMGSSFDARRAGRKLAAVAISAARI